MRPLSKVAPDWWDYTTLDRAILDDAARLSAGDLLATRRLLRTENKPRVDTERPT